MGSKGQGFLLAFYAYTVPGFAMGHGPETPDSAMISDCRHHR